MRAPPERIEEPVLVRLEHAAYPIDLFLTRESGHGWSSSYAYRLPSMNEAGLSRLECVSRLPPGWSFPNEEQTSAQSVAFGWPWPSMHSIFHIGTLSTSLTHVWHLQQTTSPLKVYFLYWKDGTANGVRPLALPTGIIPEPFAGSSMLYAASWWTLFLGLSRARAWNRRRRGLCGGCAYDLRGLEPGAVCPECGTERQVRAPT